MEYRIASILCLYFLLLSTLDSSHALRILVVFPMAAKSHNILGQGVVNNLLDAGHEVVFLTSYPRKNPVKNLTEIDCSKSAVELKKQYDLTDSFKLKNLVGKGNFADSIGFVLLVSQLDQVFLEYEPVKNFLSDPKEKFDLVILEWFFSQNFAGIPQLFQCPFIWIGSTELHGGILKTVDEIPNPAFSADIFSTNVPPFNFWERTMELASACWRQLVGYFIIAPSEKSMYNRVYADLAAKRGVAIAPYEEAAYNGSMILVNSHPSTGSSFKLPQSVKYIGGYHIDRNVKPLPKDLQKLMDESKHGVVYFSMGSNLQSKDMSTNMKESLIKMFGALKEDVIWKFEEDMENIPPNVHLVKWAPQTSILAHPNIRLFITHGGQLSTTEAIHFGVPVVGLPIFGDQYVNMQIVVKKGFGVMLQISEDFTEDLRGAVEKVLRNPEYTKQAKYLSSVYHDRIITPGEELVYWAEHVVRTRGAPHLRSPAFMVPWYQKIYLDLAAVLILMIFLMYACVKKGWRIWRSTISKKMKKN